MKIVIATPFYPPQVGVLATYAEGIGTALRSLGHEVEIVVLDSRLPAGIRHAVYLIRMLRALRGASFVLSLDTWSVGIPTCVAAIMRNVPLLLRIGGDFVWEQYIERTGDMVRLSEFYASPRAFSLRERTIQSLTAWLLRRAAYVFFNTNFQREIWLSAYGIPSPKSSVLENYIPPRVQTGAPTGRVFVSANRSARYKNVSRMEAAFIRVKGSHPDVELDMRILPHQEQLERLASAYAAIIPSISEIGSNIAIESVVRGRPFITTEDTGTKERLGECGIFIDTRSDVAIERAIESLLDPDTYARYAAKAAAFSFVRNWDDIASDIVRVAQKV